VLALLLLDEPQEGKDEWNTMLRPRWPQVRDWLLFAGGLAIAAHEVGWQRTERPSVLILSATMMGLPMFLKGSGDK
jgi:hypothetical protein